MKMEAHIEVSRRLNLGHNPVVSLTTSDLLHLFIFLDDSRKRQRAAGNKICSSAAIKESRLYEKESRKLRLIFRWVHIT